MGVKKNKLNLSTKILIAMVLGAIVGLALKILPQSAQVNEWLVNGVLQIGGAVFINLMKMLVVPLVLFSLICGVSSLHSLQTLSEIGLKTLLWFFLTTIIAIILALFFANIFNVGVGMHLPATTNFHPGSVSSLKQFIIDIVPSNPIAALSQGNMLQIIVFAILFGLAINVSGEYGKRIALFFNDLNAIFMKLVFMLMETAPYGVFCLIAVLFAQMGWQILLQLLNYFLVVLFVLLVHTFVVYSILLRVLARLNPLTFFRKMFATMLFAFGTSSSNASLPLTLETVENKLGVKNSVASFVISLGININKNGTAIMQGVATVFIAHAYGISLSLVSYLMIIFTATLAAAGTAGALSTGILMLIIVLKQVGLPIEGIALIIGIDRFLDMARTAVNVTGNAVVACIVGKFEKCLDLHKYNY